MPVKCLFAVPAALALCAQAPTKEVLDGPAARKAFQRVLDAVAAGWFGKPYQPINAVDLQGTLGISLTPQALNAQVDQLSQGRAKGELTKGATVNLKLKGTYFASGDFRTELSGDFGNLLYSRVGNRGFLYSKEQNAYTTKVPPPPPDAPLSFMSWFRQVTNDIKAVYVDGSTFRATLAKSETVGGQTIQTVTFVAPTSSYDPKKREQSLAESLGFWKRGRLEVTFDKATGLPGRLTFSNEAQGVTTRMEFTYDGRGRLLAVNADNESRGAQGPAALRVGYGGDGLINHVAGNLNSQRQNITFDLGLIWSKGRKVSSILSVPPPGASKKGGEEMKTLLAVSLAGRILDLQRKGLNLRSVTLAN